MKIIPKTPEHIHAQTTAFVDTIPVLEHRSALSRQIAHVATELTANRPVLSIQEKFATISNETVEMTVEPDQYVNFLRQLSPEERADVAFLADASKRYSDFRESVEQATHGANEESTNYLGRGIGGRAYRFSQDGVDYAVKFGNNSWSNIPAFRRAKDIDGVSHLYAADLDNNIAVMNLVPGTLADKMSFAEKDAIPTEHLEAAIAKAIEMFKKGLMIDPKPSNFLYDKDKGFGFIDYRSRVHSQYDTLSNQVMGLTTMLQVVTDNDTYQTLTYGTPEYAAFNAKRTAETIKVQSKFLDILESDYPEIINEAAQSVAKDRDDPRTATGGPLMDIYNLPEGAIFKEYAQRVQRLGLAGDKPKPKPIQSKPALILSDSHSYNDSDFV